MNTTVIAYCFAAAAGVILAVVLLWSNFTQPIDEPPAEPDSYDLELSDQRWPADHRQEND
jgi:hypothetical protein